MVIDTIFKKIGTCKVNHFKLIVILVLNYIEFLILIKSLNKYSLDAFNLLSNNIVDEKVY